MRTIQDLLHTERLDILDEASSVVARLEHYRRDGELATHRRLEALYGQVEAAVEQRDLAGIVAHAAAIARERFESGFDHSEVLAAFTTLEDSIRRRTLDRLVPDERAWGLGLVGTAFAHGRESLGRTYSALDTTDLTPLFTGAYCDADGRSDSDSVHPV
jgi:hypothetical protein